MGRFAVGKDAADIRRTKNKPQISGFRIPYTAVGGARNGTGFKHIPKSDMLLSKKPLLFIHADRPLRLPQQRKERPETVLRMTVIKLTFSGFDGRKRTENQDL